MYVNQVAVCTNVHTSGYSVKNVSSGGIVHVLE